MDNVPVATSGQISPFHQAAITQLSSGTRHLAAFIPPYERGRGETIHPQEANRGRRGMRNTTKISDRLLGHRSDGCFL